MKQILFFIYCFPLFLMGQPVVDICLQKNVSDISIFLNYTGSFQGVVSNIQFTVESDDPSVNFGNIIQINPEGIYIPMEKAGNDSLVGGKKYQTYVGTGLVDMNQSGMNTNWCGVGNILLMKIVPSSLTGNFAIVNNSYSNITNRNLYIELNGLDRTGTITSSLLAGLAPNISGTNVLCFGNTTGAADLTVTGGTSPYNYLWSNGATTEDLNGIGVGTYNVTITDINNCTTTASVTITQPSAGLSANATGINVLCFGNSTGSADLTVTGGTTPYSYSWSNGATTEDLSGLAAGTYTVTITDAVSCTATTSVTITQPAAGLSANATGVNVLCFGNNTGSADLSVIGGTTPYTYNWSNGATTEDLSGLAAGTYTVTITDAGNCTTTASVTITQPSAGLSANATGVNVLCFGNSTGSADLSVIGGTTPYTYNWSNGATTEDLSGLSAGTYTVTITDAVSCTTTASVTITQPAAGLSATATSVNVLCFGNSTGSADLTVTGGTTPYSFSWSNGAVSEDLTGLAAGSYSVTVSDGHGCTETAGITIIQPTTLSIGITGIDVSCYGGSTGAADLTVTGGVLPYSYLWSSGAVSEDLTGLTLGSYSVVVTDSNNCTALANVDIAQPDSALTIVSININEVDCYSNYTGSALVTISGGTTPYYYTWNVIPAQSTSLLSNIGAGTYSFSVLDANRCIVESMVTITQPQPLVITVVNQTDVDCNGNHNGSASVSVSGGTLGYNYLWNTIPEQNSATAVGLSGGTYDITVSDSNQCSITTSVTIDEPALITINAIVTDATCYGGSNGGVNVTVSGGTPPYNFSWSNGAITEDISGVVSNGYELYITDANGCSMYRKFWVGQPAPLMLSVTNNNPCIGGNLLLNATLAGNNAGATYSWAGPNGFTSNLQNPVITNAVATMSGTYSVTVALNNCNVSGSTNVIVNPVPAYINISSNTNTICQGNSVLLTASVPPGTVVKWYLGTAYKGTGATYNATQSGVYTARAHINNQATCYLLSNPVTITVLPAPQPVINSLPNGGTVLVCGLPAQLTATATNAPPVSSYQWQIGNFMIGTFGNIPGAITNTYSASLAQKYYRVNVVYQNGCTKMSQQVRVSVTNCKTAQQGNIIIYPNPADEVLTIAFDNEAMREIKLYNVLGEKVLGYKGAEKSVTFDISGITQGIYFVKIFSEEGERILDEKVIIE